MYAEFKAGRIGAGYKSIVITSKAHPDVLSEAKCKLGEAESMNRQIQLCDNETSEEENLSLQACFINAQNEQIRFRDSSENTISIFPHFKTVEAEFNNGKHLAKYLPTKYEDYKILYKNIAILNNTDLDYITNLSNAKFLWLGQYFLIDSELGERIAGMKKMTKLEEIVVEIRPINLENQLNPFLFIASNLKKATFLLPSFLNSEEQRTFAHNQNVPDSWKMEFIGQAIIFEAL